VFKPTVYTVVVKSLHTPSRIC